MTRAAKRTFLGTHPGGDLSDAYGPVIKRDLTDVHASATKHFSAFDESNFFAIGSCSTLIRDSMSVIQVEIKKAHRCPASSASAPDNDPVVL